MYKLTYTDKFPLSFHTFWKQKTGGIFGLIYLPSNATQYNINNIIGQEFSIILNFPKLVAQLTSAGA